MILGCRKYNQSTNELIWNRAQRINFNDNCTISIPIVSNRPLGNLELLCFGDNIKIFPHDLGNRIILPN